MENTLTSFINRVDFVKNSEMGHPIYRVTFTPSKGKTMIGYTRSKSHLSQICPSFEGDTCDVAYDINDKGKVIVRDIKKCGGEMNESKLKKMINESVRKALNEVGDTPEGQRKLGALHARKALRDDNYESIFDQKSKDLYDYAKNARGGDEYDMYGNNMNPMYKDYAEGYVDYMGAHPEEYFDAERRREKYNESKLRRIVGESMNRVLKENKEQPDFYDFIDILERNGWSYSDFHDVQTKDGRTGTRFIVYKDDKSSSDFETLQQDLQKLFGDHVDFGIAQYRYASEIKHRTVIILDYNDDDASAPLNESKLRRIIKESMDRVMDGQKEKVKIIFDPENVYKAGSVVNVNDLIKDYLDTVNDDWILRVDKDKAVDFIADAWGLKIE